MTINIMTENGSIIPCHTVTLLTTADLIMLDMKRQCIIFDNLIRKKHADSMNFSPGIKEATKLKKQVNCSFIPYKDDIEEPQLVQENNVIDMHVSLVNASVNAKILLPQGEESEGYESSNLV